MMSEIVNEMLLSCGHPLFPKTGIEKYQILKPDLLLPRARDSLTSASAALNPDSGARLGDDRCVRSTNGVTSDEPDRRDPRSEARKLGGVGQQPCRVSDSEFA